MPRTADMLRLGQPQRDQPDQNMEPMAGGGAGSATRRGPARMTIAEVPFGSATARHAPRARLTGAAHQRGAQVLIDTNRRCSSLIFHALYNRSWSDDDRQDHHAGCEVVRQHRQVKAKNHDKEGE